MTFELVEIEPIRERPGFKAFFKGDKEELLSITIEKKKGSSKSS
jgi:hypothetical protein